MDPTVNVECGRSTPKPGFQTVTTSRNRRRRLVNVGGVFSLMAAHALPRRLLSLKMGKLNRADTTPQREPTIRRTAFGEAYAGEWADTSKKKVSLKFPKSEALYYCSTLTLTLEFLPARVSLREYFTLHEPCTCTPYGRDSKSAQASSPRIRRLYTRQCIINRGVSRMMSA